MFSSKNDYSLNNDRRFDRDNIENRLADYMIRGVYGVSALVALHQSTKSSYIKDLRYYSREYKPLSDRKKNNAYEMINDVTTQHNYLIIESDLKRVSETISEIGPLLKDKTITETFKEEYKIKLQELIKERASLSDQLDSLYNSSQKSYTFKSFTNEGIVVNFENSREFEMLLEDNRRFEPVNLIDETNKMEARRLNKAARVVQGTNIRNYRENIEIRRESLRTHNERLNRIVERFEHTLANLDPTYDPTGTNGMDTPVVTKIERIHNRGVYNLTFNINVAEGASPLVVTMEVPDTSRQDKLFRRILNGTTTATDITDVIRRHQTISTDSLGNHYLFYPEWDHYNGLKIRTTGEIVEDFYISKLSSIIDYTKNKPDLNIKRTAVSDINRLIGGWDKIPSGKIISPKFLHQGSLNYVQVLNRYINSMHDPARRKILNHELLKAHGKGISEKVRTRIIDNILTTVVEDIKSNNTTFAMTLSNGNTVNVTSNTLFKNMKPGQATRYSWISAVDTFNEGNSKGTSAFGPNVVSGIDMVAINKSTPVYTPVFQQGRSKRFPSTSTQTNIYNLETILYLPESMQKSFGVALDQSIRIDKYTEYLNLLDDNIRGHYRTNKNRSLGVIYSLSKSVDNKGVPIHIKPVMQFLKGINSDGSLLLSIHDNKRLSVTEKFMNSLDREYEIGQDRISRSIRQRDGIIKKVNKAIEARNNKHNYSLDDKFFIEFTKDEARALNINGKHNYVSDGAGKITYVAVIDHVKHDLNNNIKQISLITDKNSVDSIVHSGKEMWKSQIVIAQKELLKEMEDHSLIGLVSKQLALTSDIVTADTMVAKNYNKEFINGMFNTILEKEIKKQPKNKGQYSYVVSNRNKTTKNTSFITRMEKVLSFLYFGNYGGEHDRMKIDSIDYSIDKNGDIYNMSYKINKTSANLVATDNLSNRILKAIKSKNKEELTFIHKKFTDIIGSSSDFVFFATAEQSLSDNKILQNAAVIFDEKENNIVMRLLNTTALPQGFERYHSINDSKLNVEFNSGGASLNLLTNAKELARANPFVYEYLMSVKAHIVNSKEFNQTGLHRAIHNNSIMYANSKMAHSRELKVLRRSIKNLSKKNMGYYRSGTEEDAAHQVVAWLTDPKLTTTMQLEHERIIKTPKSTEDIVMNIINNIEVAKERPLGYSIDALGLKGSIYMSTTQADAYLKHTQHNEYIAALTNTKEDTMSAIWLPTELPSNTKGNTATDIIYNVKVSRGDFKSVINKLDTDIQDHEKLNHYLRQVRELGSDNIYQLSDTASAEFKLKQIVSVVNKIETMYKEDNLTIQTDKDRMKEVVSVLNIAIREQSKQLKDRLDQRRTKESYANLSKIKPELSINKKIESNEVFRRTLKKTAKYRDVDMYTILGTDSHLKDIVEGGFKVTDSAIGRLKADKTIYEFLEEQNTINDALSTMDIDKELLSIAEVKGWASEENVQHLHNIKEGILSQGISNDIGYKERYNDSLLELFRSDTAELAKALSSRTPKDIAKSNVNKTVLDSIHKLHILLIGNKTTKTAILNNLINEYKNINKANKTGNRLNTKVSKLINNYMTEEYKKKKGLDLSPIPYTRRQHVRNVISIPIAFERLLDSYKSKIMSGNVDFVVGDNGNLLTTEDVTKNITDRLNMFTDRLINKTEGEMENNKVGKLLNELKNVKGHVDLIARELSEVSFVVKDLTTGKGASTTLISYPSIIAGEHVVPTTMRIILQNNVLKEMEGNDRDNIMNGLKILNTSETMWTHPALAVAMNRDYDGDSVGVMLNRFLTRGSNIESVKGWGLTSSNISQLMYNRGFILENGKMNPLNISTALHLGAVVESEHSVETLKFRQVSEIVDEEIKKIRTGLNGEYKTFKEMTDTDLKSSILNRVIQHYNLDITGVKQQGGKLIGGDIKDADIENISKKLYILADGVSTANVVDAKQMKVKYFGSDGNLVVEKVDKKEFHSIKNIQTVLNRSGSTLDTKYLLKMDELAKKNKGFTKEIGTFLDTLLNNDNDLSEAVLTRSRELEQSGIDISALRKQKTLAGDLYKYVIITRMLTESLDSNKINYNIKNAGMIAQEFARAVYQNTVISAKKGLPDITESFESLFKTLEEVGKLPKDDFQKRITMLSDSINRNGLEITLGAQELSFYNNTQVEKSYLLRDLRKNKMSWGAYNELLTRETEIGKQILEHRYDNNTVRTADEIVEPIIKKYSNVLVSGAHKDEVDKLSNDMKRMIGSGSTKDFAKLTNKMQSNINILEKLAPGMKKSVLAVEKVLESVASIYGSSSNTDSIKTLYGELTNVSSIHDLGTLFEDLSTSLSKSKSNPDSLAQSLNDILSRSKNANIIEKELNAGRRLFSRNTTRLSVNKYKLFSPSLITGRFGKYAMAGAGLMAMVAPSINVGRPLSSKYNTGSEINNPIPEQMLKNYNNQVTLEHVPSWVSDKLKQEQKDIQAYHSSIST